MSTGWAPLLAALGGLAGGLDVPAGDVDLAKTAVPEGGWSGRRVGEVLDVAAIERVVLLKALTSATGGHDLQAIRRMLDVAAAQPFLDGPAPRALLDAWPEGSVWEAVILTRDGTVFGFSADGERACLRGPDGRSGCFAPPPATD
ncbi:MAG TPA: hypothetical protein VFF91_08875 [Pseudoxanthomonas sp.]|nr:hypothetical protein [Pseudoxanthomonas sp.]